MYQSDDPTCVVSLPTPASSGTPGYYTDGNPGLGDPATIVRADHLNMMQKEILNVVTAAGLTPSKTTYNQLLTALGVLFGGGGGAVASFKITQFLGSGTFTRDAKSLGAFIGMCGPSGATAGCSNTSPLGVPGAAAGASLIAYLTASQLGATQTVTLGAPGVGGTTAPTGGTAGGNTTFGALLTCPGGGSGPAGSSGAFQSGNNGGTPTVGTGAPLLLVNGGAGETGGNDSSGGAVHGGKGGDSLFGSGGPQTWGTTGATTAVTGLAPTGYGAGPSGPCAQTTMPASAGSDGNQGIVVVVEMLHA